MVGWYMNFDSKKSNDIYSQFEAIDNNQKFDSKSEIGYKQQQQGVDKMKKK